MTFAHIEVSAATHEQAPIIANLMQLYAHDFSEFYPLQFGADGRFDYKDLPLYWRDPDRHPFLIRADGNLAGFALVKRGSEVSGKNTAWDLAEFFVVRWYRRKGIGTAVAHQVWRNLPGQWEVRVLQSNQTALPFWEQVIEAFVGKVIHPVPVEKDGDSWNLFSFVSE